MKHLSLLVVAVLMGITTMAQSPSKFNYQAVARDASGVVVSSGTVGVKVSILTGSATGTEVYSETHSAATNVYGMLNFQIGAGAGATGDISTINWGSDAHFIKVEMDPAGGTSYTVTNTSELISVPYAEYANSALHVDDADADSTNEVQMMMMSGDTLMLSIGGGSIDMSGYDQSAGVASNDSAITAHVTADMDVDSTNELITDMMLDGDTMLQITEDGVTHEVDLTALVNDDDWVRSGDTLYNTADSLIGIGTNDPVTNYKMTLDPGNNLGGLYIDREYSASGTYGVYNNDYYGSGFRYGLYNVLYDGSSGAYGILQNIYYMNSTEYGVYNNMYYGTGTTYGMRNYIYKTASSGTNYGVYNYIRGVNSNNYGNYSQVTNYYASNYGYAYGSYNYAYKSSGNYGRTYGTYNQSYMYENYGYAYGTYNYAYAGGSYYDYAYGTYNYASGGYYGNYASYNSGLTYSTGGFSSSDRKLKKNIRNYEGAINDIMQLQPRVYEFDLEKYPTMGLPEVEQLGLVAQELEEVFPNLIKETHNPKLQMTESNAIEQGFEYEIITPAEYDEDDKLLHEAQVEAGEAVDFKAVNYTALIPVLIKGIQEQQAIINANEAMIEDLKARIETLENN
ncbi:tail fiber domain-containing protein [Salibacteraceae bacterium]|nr:tail fiber domain-containing protein [Salibacteraceae bacterium]